MFQKLKEKTGRFFFSNYVKKLELKEQELKTKEKEVDLKINQKVAEIISKMDPFQPLMQKYNSVLSVEYERVEDALNEQGKVGMYMWGWQQKSDPHFERMVSWIMNKAGNALLKTGNPTEIQVFYKRAEIANMILYRKEIGRLSTCYEDILGKKGKSEQGEFEV